MTVFDSYDFDNAVDLTHELANGMPSYPGDPVPSFRRTATIEKDGVNVSMLEMGSHCGTHMDAPSHFVSGGTPIDQIPVKHLIGEAVVGDFSFKKRGSGITSEDIKKVLLNDAQTEGRRHSSILYWMQPTLGKPRGQQ